jgi:D-glycero-D-manno-heptose 1,7-bisphosphate phosphatase
MGSGSIASRRAVFLDRDGVLNYNVPNPQTGELEAPLTSADFRLIPGVLQSLRLLQESGFLLILVSNQPNFAQGKATLNELEAIHDKLKMVLDEAKISFTGFSYCFHHPRAVVRSLLGPCECRKPSPYYLLRARDEHAIDLSQSWMVGDRDTDVQCGKSAGVRTIRISDGAAGVRAEAGAGGADFTVSNLVEAVGIVLA